ncbi:MAG: hypothetical protein IT447_00615 [Phycisphaerales bacterium]|jgi:hypothetical protein|nr:hypothetical protein [Phycisphaerales bacterium]
MKKMALILTVILSMGIMVTAGCEKDQTDDGSTIKGTHGGTTGTGYSNSGEPGSSDYEINRPGYGLAGSSDRAMSPYAPPPPVGTGSSK